MGVERHAPGAQPGDAAGTALLTYTSAARSVTVPVEATEVGTVKAGVRAGITLPDGRTVRGRVTALGRTVQGGTGADPAAQTAPATVDVTVVPDRPADVAGLDAAAVQVRFFTAARKGVLGAVAVGMAAGLCPAARACGLPPAEAPATV
ncbi:hypothetical protein ABZX30_23225 [Streptomyces sp. NPDC004542]|uniref:hypothetical protein n=1 Tax=Streptomyces sp. NPDC004542 TaxID=3154281 RepID=UPI00339E4BBE